MAKQHKVTFETKLVDLNTILIALKEGGLSLKEITEKVKLAKEIYQSCKEELESAKLVLSEIKEEK